METRLDSGFGNSWIWRFLFLLRKRQQGPRSFRPSACVWPVFSTKYPLRRRSNGGKSPVSIVRLLHLLSPPFLLSPLLTPSTISVAILFAPSIPVSPGVVLLSASLILFLFRRFGLQITGLGSRISCFVFRVACFVFREMCYKVRVSCSGSDC